MKYEYVGDLYGNERMSFDSIDEFKTLVLEAFDNDQDVADELSNMTMHSDGDWYVGDELILSPADED